MSYFTELLGTLFVVLLGCGCAVFADASGAVYHLVVAITFGLSTYALSSSCSARGLGCFNPALTIALWFGARLTGRQALGYIAAQVLGSILAAAVLYLLVGSLSDASATPFAAAAVTCAPTSGNVSAFLVETLMTCALTYAVLGSLGSEAEARETHPAVPVSGMTGASAVYAVMLTVCLVVSLPVSGGGLNPARAFGPALLVGGEALSQLWLYVIAPISGAALAVGLQKRPFHRCF